ncbi:hypothetical protein [Paracraurococcus lichenis]|uniref:Uncharacterized protein n=1 Tax=Paracraurococcus lichenis TaxID=3064888 RepID=A0ABT9EBD1_9PROT|nr:hypothetical protein [Paracraurococcus sp. LOR1-02]MDO9713522.1 hypothetical protein [Paracraurococcus sp. LOR1-02]
MDLTSEQFAAARAAGCAFFPAIEAQVQRLTMQRRIFRLDGKAFMVTRDGAFYETHGTLLQLIEDYRHFIASHEPALTDRGSQPNAAPPNAAVPQCAEARKQNAMPAPDASRHTAILETAGAVPSSKTGPRSEGQPYHKADLKVGAAPASPKPEPRRSEGVMTENLAPPHGTQPSVPKRRRVRQTERLVLEPQAPARTPAVESGDSQSASSSSVEVQHESLPQASSNTATTEPEETETRSTAAEKAARRGGGRPRASRHSDVREAKAAPEPQPELPFSEPAAPEPDAVNVKDENLNVASPQISTGRLRTAKKRAGQPKAPRWVTAGAARRGRQK